MRRFSVLTVSGTGLNTRRSPSVMRLVNTSSLSTGTAETPEMRWRRHNRTVLTPTGWCSALQTVITTIGLMAIVSVLVMAKAGGHCSASCPNNEFSTGWTTGSPPSDVQVSRMLHGVVQVNITVAPSSEWNAPTVVIYSQLTCLDRRTCRQTDGNVISIAEC